MDKHLQLLLLSSANVFGSDFLEYAKSDIINLLLRNKVKTVLFVPYALKDYDKYVEKVAKIFNKWNYDVVGIHKGDPINAVNEAQAIFIGGGNTFVLLKTLYDHQLIEPIRNRVLKQGIPYIGTSAGSNIATISIHTTNDMPIVYPPSFNALALVPFNINAHYVDADPKSEHQGETREERILQFLDTKDASVVVGLREGSTLSVYGNQVFLKGIKNGRLFIKGEPPVDVKVNTDLSYILNKCKAIK